MSRTRSFSRFTALPLLAACAACAPVCAAPLIAALGTGRARYSPDTAVRVSVRLVNGAGRASVKGVLGLSGTHLGRPVTSPPPQAFRLAPGTMTMLSFRWRPPSRDFQGCLVEAKARDSSGRLLDRNSVAIDVSSSWTRFPRYGFLSGYPPQPTETSRKIVRDLSLFHLNTLWNGLANRPTSRQTLLDLIASAHGCGWQVDQAGEGGDQGDQYDAQGRPVTVWKTFRPFLNAAKTALHKTILFNNVGTYGLYDTASQAHPGRFNAPGARLTDALLFASGGSHIEPGDDGRLLDNEYFPNGNLVPGPDLMRALRRDYDFLTAYESLLRGGLTPDPGAVTLRGVSARPDAAPDFVWAKAGGGFRVLHLINLMGEKDMAWRDDRADRPAPVPRTSLAVKYYPRDLGTIPKIYRTSPDRDIAPLPLKFTQGMDGRGKYVRFTVPRLEYWDMLFFRTKPTQKAEP